MDFLWLSFIQHYEVDEEEGGAATAIKGFSLFFAKCSFVFRIILILVVWRVSHDFLSIIKGKSGDAKP